VSRFKNAFPALIFIIVSIIVYLQALNIRTLKFGGALGGDFFPKVLSILMLVISVIWLIREIVISAKKKGFDAATENNSSSWLKKGVRDVFVFLAVFIVYIFSLRYFGFLIPSVILVFFNFVLLKDDFNAKNLPVAIIYSLVITVGLWYLFEKVFELVLPKGMYW